MKYKVKTIKNRKYKINNKKNQRKKLQKNKKKKSLNQKRKPRNFNPSFLMQPKTMKIQLKKKITVFFRATPFLKRIQTLKLFLEIQTTIKASNSKAFLNRNQTFLIWVLNKIKKMSRMKMTKKQKKKYI